MRKQMVVSLLTLTTLGVAAAAQQGGPPAGGGPAAGPRQPSETRQFETPPMPFMPNDGLGETDQPLIPGQPWRVRDLNRPKPSVVTPGRHAGDPPSDAIVLFNGTDLSQWIVSAGRGAVAPEGAGWTVKDGYMEVTPGFGGVTSRERFRDFQLHVEFATPGVPLGISQYRGNSGILIGGREIQILDNYNNQTYADGYVGAVYGQWPPLANPSLPPGQWQTLDIAYMAPRYEGETLVRNPVITVFMNGVMIHNNREIQPRGGGPGPGVGRGAPAAGRGGAPGAGRGSVIPPGDPQPVTLSGHTSAIAGNAVRYRNVWARHVTVELPSPVPANTGGGAAVP
jgi:hypothetical protein